MVPFVCTHDLGRSVQSRWLFRHRSWERRTPGVVAVVGPNGSGKTTLLRILAGLTAPSEGQVRILGYSVDDAPRQVQRFTAWVPVTDGGFFPRLKGLENLRLFAALAGYRESHVQTCLERLQGFTSLLSALQTPYALCSTGMRQALQLARALIKSPAVLLLDEPFRSLDKATRQELEEVIRTLSQKHLILFSSHHEQEIQLADEILTLGAAA